MWYTLLLGLLFLTFGASVYSGTLVLRYKTELSEEREEKERINMQYQAEKTALANKLVLTRAKANRHVKRLKKELKDAYSSLELALEASPGPFTGVTVELGLNGVIYQFHQLEQEEETHS